MQIFASRHGSGQSLSSGENILNSYIEPVWTAKAQELGKLAKISLKMTMDTMKDRSKLSERLKNCGLPIRSFSFIGQLPHYLATFTQHKRIVDECKKLTKYKEGVTVHDVLDLGVGLHVIDPLLAITARKSRLIQCQKNKLLATVSRILKSQDNYVQQTTLGKPSPNREDQSPEYGTPPT